MAGYVEDRQGRDGPRYGGGEYMRDRRPPAPGKTLLIPARRAPPWLAAPR